MTARSPADLGAVPIPSSWWRRWYRYHL